MSDFKPSLKCNFINRRTGATIGSIPFINRITVNKDITQFTDAFDFDISFRLTDKIDLRSHDFVEFYFVINKARFQICAGYIEDFVKSTENTSLKFQANGRDFLGQLMNLPFLNAKPINQTTLTSFCSKILDQTYISTGDPSGTYLKEYQDIKGITKRIEDLGAYTGPVIVPELSDSKIAPVLQNISEEVFNVIYQDRHGRMVIWGRNSGKDIDTGLWISDVRDSNVTSFSLRENFSKVFSSVKIQYVSAEGNLDYANTPSREQFNSEQKARQIFQPEVRTFNTGTLVNTVGQVGIDQKRNQLAASILRRSNQGLARVVIKTPYPFYVAKTGELIPYEVNQLWNIKSEIHGLSQKMRLIGIGYTQDSSNLDVELCFIGSDTLV